jgi:hypothetical protein
MTIKVTYNVTDVYVTQDVSPVYINVSYSGGGSGGAAVWGGITGTLSDQTDLQTALDGKFDDPTGDTTQYIAGDGSLVAFPITGQAGTLVREVRNVTGATITKGTVVYINGASGNKPTVAKALATSDATSAQTFGLIQADIPNNSNGYLVAFGDLDGLNTSAFAEGVQLYLSATTAGAYTSTKQYAPNHLVYIGVVTRQHVNQGRIEVRIQNGYEMDELHDVAAQTPSNNDGLFYNSTNSLWENKSIATALGYTPANAATTLTINGVTYDLSTSRTFTVGSVTGSGASGQVAYWTGTSAQAGSNNLFWDNANGRLGIGTNAPARALDVRNTAIFTANATNFDAVLHIENTGNASQGNKNVAIFIGARGNSGDIDDNTNIGLWQKNNTVNNYGVFNFYNSAGQLSTYFGTQYLSHGAGTSGNFLIGTTNAGTKATKLQIFANGNLLLQNGGTFTDGGQRLQVQGDAFIKGSGNTNATTALTVQNSAGLNILMVSNYGATTIRGGTAFDGDNAINILNSNAASIFNIWNSGIVFINRIGTSARLQIGQTTIEETSSGAVFAFALRPTTNFTTSTAFSGYSVNFTNPQSITSSGGETFHVNITATLAPTSGGSPYTSLRLNPTINQTGGANGITRGLYVNPTLTAAADWRSIEWSNNSGWGLYGAGTANNYLGGNLLLGSTTNSGERLQVTGTSKVTGASSFGGNMTLSLNQNAATTLTISNTDNSANSVSNIICNSNTAAGSFVFGKFSSSRNAVKIVAATDSYIYNITAGDIAILNDFASGSIKFAAGGSSTAHMTIKSNGRINMSSLPTSPTGLSSGDLWNNLGMINIV